MNDVLVIGGGAWGSALAIHAVRLGHTVALWARNPATAGQRLRGVALPASLPIIADMAPAAVYVVAVPMQVLRPVLCLLPSGTPAVLCCKGVEAATHRLPLEIAGAILPGTHHYVLSGPNFAHEIAAGLPAAAVIAGGDAAGRERMVRQLGGGAFRLYGNADSIGVQLGGAGKNVLALAAGAVMGAGVGENARAALVTRGLAELGRLAVALGGRAETMAGLAGLGDVVLSCAGPTSRNFALGFGLGQGGTIGALMPEDGPVVEAVHTAPALLARAGGLDVPILRAVAALWAQQTTVAETVGALLARPARDE